MPTTALSDFYTALRTILGDTDPYGVYDRQDGELDGALRSVFLLGKGPTGYALEGDRQSAAGIAPEVPNGDDFAIITYEAALLLVGGESGGDSYRTRALSVSRSGNRRNSLLMELKVKIREIRDGGECFATVQSFVSWMNSLTSLPEQILANALPPNLPHVSIPDFPL